MPSACSGDDAYLAISSSKVPLGSSMRAHSSPGQSPSICRGVLARVSTPSASASRLAGSMVTTQARRPRRAASRAKAADTVVLPTPPDPQHTTMARSVDELRRARPWRRAPGGRWTGLTTRPRRRVVVGGRARRPGPAGGRRVGRGRRAVVVGQPAHRPGELAASTSSSSGPIPALKRNGAWSWGRGSSAARRARCSSWSPKRRARKLGRGPQRAGLVVGQGDARPRPRPRRGSTLEAGGRREGRR